MLNLILLLLIFALLAIGICVDLLLKQKTRIARLQETLSVYKELYADKGKKLDSLTAKCDDQESQINLLLAQKASREIASGK